MAERPPPFAWTWAGNPWSLAGICFLNILLIVLTVGIYWFWARTGYWRRMWQMVRIEGEPIEYTGTGGELLIGYLKLFAFVILPAVAVLVWDAGHLGPHKSLERAGNIYRLYRRFLELFAGVFRATRYILSRTRWRGIAFGLREGAAGYAWTALWSAFVMGLTLGWLMPWRTTALRRRITNAMHFGSVPFRFEGDSGPLYGPFALLWISGMAAYAGIFAI